MRIGVDEAGKGPVLGPMVAVAVAVPGPECLPDGVADSKRLAADRRESLAAAIRGDDRIGVGVAAVPVDRIDDPETDMNSLTVAAQAEAVEALPDDCQPATDGAGECALLADAGDTSEARFRRRLAAAVPPGIEVEAEHGADDADPVVAAASIVAKVSRDARMAEIGDALGMDRAPLRTVLHHLDRYGDVIDAPESRAPNGAGRDD